MRLQIYAGGGGTVYLPQPNFTNYVLASHYYGQTRKYGIVTPFAEVRLWYSSIPSLACIYCDVIMSDKWLSD